MVLDWFVNYVPRWLGPTAIVCGLFVCSVGLFRSGLDQLFSRVDSRFEYVLPAIVGLIYVWAMTNLLALPGYIVRHPAAYAVIFTFGAKWIEGVSAVIIYPKLRYVATNLPEVVRTFSTPSQTTLTQTIVRGLVLYFLGILASYALIGVLLFQQGLSIPGGNLLVVAWTVLTFTVSLLGLIWKVSTVELPTYLLYGTVLILSGAEVVNLATIGADFRVYLAGGLGYALGYFTLLGLWLLPGETLTTASRYGEQG